MTVHHALVLNLHQPADNLQAMLDEDNWEAKEILYALDRIPRSLWGYEDLARVHLSLSGTLLETLSDPSFQERVYGIVDCGSLLWRLQNQDLFEILGTGYYHPVLPLIPACDWPPHLQRWLDLAPVFFEDIAILREPIYNVATWNLTHRPVAGSLERGFTINGEPLSFYHFSGFDSGAQEVMLKKYADTDSVLFDLRRWYIAECQRLGQEDLGNRRCRYDTFDNGERITRTQRILYRSRLDLQRAFPHPFRAGGHSYYHWHQINAKGADASDEALETEAMLRAQLNDARRQLDLIQRSRSWRLARTFARLRNLFR